MGVAAAEEPESDPVDAERRDESVDFDGLALDPAVGADMQVLPWQAAAISEMQVMLAAAGGEGAEIVFGIQIQDNGLAQVVRRVVILAALAATFYIGRFISNLLRGFYSATSTDTMWTAISTLLIELSVPACGYYGALQGNRQLTCCFCSCNLFFAMYTIISFIHLEIEISRLNGECERENNPSRRRTCELWTSSGVDKYYMLSSTVIVMCLGLLAFWFGNSLYQRLSQDFSTGPTSMPLVGEVISLTSDTDAAQGASPGLPEEGLAEDPAGAAVAEGPTPEAPQDAAGGAPADAEEEPEVLPEGGIAAAGEPPARSPVAAPA